MTRTVQGNYTIDHASVQTEVEGYTTKTYTLTDSLTILGLGSNDPSSVPKTTVKSGVTLKLTNVDWVVQKSEAVDYNTIPTEYKAVASSPALIQKKYRQDISLRLIIPVM